MKLKLFEWLFHRGFEKGYNSALWDVQRSMKDRKLEDLEWELELLRL